MREIYRNSEYSDSCSSLCSLSLPIIIIYLIFVCKSTKIVDPIAL